MNIVKNQIYLVSVLVGILGGIILITELSYPFKSIQLAFIESPENMLKIDWLLLVRDYRTSIIGGLLCFLGFGLLTDGLRFGWVLSMVMSICYSIIYSREFILNVINGRHQAQFFLITMICLCLFIVLILLMKKNRKSLKISLLELFTFLIISAIYLQQYYR